MPETLVTDPNDPRLIPYRDLRRTNLTRWSDHFIAEGGLVVARLLESSLKIESVLLSQRRRNLLDDANPVFAQQVLVVPDSLARELLGYNFHAGWLACGLRLARRERIDPPQLADAAWVAVACSKITSPDNLGAIIRLCSVFGVHALLLGRGSADPFSRRVLRVSMGQAFRQPLIETDHLSAELARLRREQGCRVVATVVGQGAQKLAVVERSRRLIILLGNEAEGLSQSLLDQSDERVTIPMAHQGDSLNVAQAAAIFLYHFVCPG